MPRWVVWSFEHAGWWRSGGWGYTPDLAEAGHFTEAEALRIEADANRYARVRNEQAMPLIDAPTFERVLKANDSDA
jgi:hypothetical protein